MRAPQQLRARSLWTRCLPIEQELRLEARDLDAHLGHGVGGRRGTSSSEEPADRPVQFGVVAAGVNSTVQEPDAVASGAFPTLAALNRVFAVRRPLIAASRVEEAFRPVPHPACIQTLIEPVPIGPVMDLDHHALVEGHVFAESVASGLNLGTWRRQFVPQELERFVLARLPR